MGAGKVARVQKGESGNGDRVGVLTLLFVLSRTVPIRAFTLWAPRRLTLSLRCPFVIAALTFPVPHDLFYFSHAGILTRKIYYRK